MKELKQQIQQIFNILNVIDNKIINSTLSINNNIKEINIDLYL